MNCEACGKPCGSVSVDSTGALGKCTCGHWTLDRGRATKGVKTGNITVRGACAIGDGAVAIGKSKSKGKKDRR
ncbi:hypothetical protein ABTZ98_33425 [Streptomyces bacillaris]|uniref:hypothetical protein n=1 Tax=unclassified Micromonospora TaxID=2617518 RepID=UPI00336127BD